jgi:hypothetical protein
MSNRTYGIILIVVGVLVVAAVFLAVPLHLASAGFGLKKLIGVVIGVVVFVAGLVVTFGKGGKWVGTKKQ